jgi:hypothetical protein
VTTRARLVVGATAGVMAASEGRYMGEGMANDEIRMTSQ